ncbi:MAG: hypothetical protein LBU76_08210 [Azoarcus sp.]|jgi:hypothetical protein|nr:hypothetical protein [Azoarcus sp.]
MPFLSEAEIENAVPEQRCDLSRAVVSNERKYGKHSTCARYLAQLNRDS